MDANPQVFDTAGQSYLKPCRILAIVWEGGTTANDTVELVDPVTSALMWPGRTSATSTYLGLSFGQNGFEAPNGIRCAKIASGRVCVYIAKA